MTVRALMTAAFLIGAAGTLQAQHPQVRDGFWISFRRFPVRDRG